MRYLILLTVLTLFFFPLLRNAEGSEVGIEGKLLAITDPLPDTTSNDSISYRISRDTLDAEVIYKAIDSIRFDLSDEKVYLFGQAEAVYKNIKLNADYIEIDWSNNLIMAKGTDDGQGHFVGEPVFVEGDQTYNAKQISYNYKTKKGKINQLFTKDGESYMHAEDAFKTPKEEMFIAKGKYTTCDEEDPHFYLSISKLKVIPNKLIAAGPSILVIEDVPLPLGVPFGIFPLNQGKKSGIIFPEYGESGNLGFFLKNGGYYFAVSDKMDLALRGDIYSRGSWKGNLTSFYAKRYKYHGNYSLDFSTTKTGDKLEPGFSLKRDFLIRWTHNQDQKARPNSNFNATINAGTGTYHTNNSHEADDVMASVFKSSINYTKRWRGKPFTFGVNLSHNHNTKSGDMSFDLPNITFDMSRVQPFKRKASVGAAKWYESFAVIYSMKMVNNLSISDSLLFNPKYPITENVINEHMRNGVIHTPAIVLPKFNLFKYLNFIPTLNYTERWYLKTIRKSWDQDSGLVVIDTVSGFESARDFSGTLTMSTKLFGMVNFKKGKIKAVRHVLTPTFGFVYHPDFGTDFWGYYKDYQIDTLGNTKRYSIFENGIVGTPASGEVGAINLRLGNNLEMKMFSKKDTVKNTKKVKILDRLNLNSSYNLAADSLRLSLIDIDGGTGLFENKVTINFSGKFDPYISDNTNVRLNKFEYDENGRLARMTNAAVSVGANFNSGMFKKKNPAPNQNSNNNLPGIDNVDYSLPWRMSVNYIFNITHNYNQRKVDTVLMSQSVSVDAEIKLTPKWKIGFSTGYNFVSKEMTYTKIDIGRDMHCWEMKFEWVPPGVGISYYNFRINVKSSVLKDLKWEKRKDWYDYE